MEKPPVGSRRPLKKTFSLGEIATGLCDLINADEFAHPPAVSKFHHARHFGKQRVILAPADIRAWFDLGTALAHDYGTAGDELAAEHLHAEPLRVGIAPVFRAA